VNFERGYIQTRCELIKTSSDKGFGFRKFLLPDATGYRIMDIVPDSPLDRFNSIAEEPIVPSSIIREVNGVTDPEQMLTELARDRVELRIAVPPSYPRSDSTSPGTSACDNSSSDNPSPR
jgi:hypothetical protein